MLLTVAGLFFLAPDSFWEVSHGHELATAGKEWINPIFGGGGNEKVGNAYSTEDELKDFLHMVASSELTIPKDVDASKPLPREIYKSDLEGVAWLQEAQADPPIIVFSKARAPVHLIIFITSYSHSSLDILPVRSLLRPVVSTTKDELIYRFSKSAKALFKGLDPSPPPKYVEVDLRGGTALTRYNTHG